MGNLANVERALHRAGALDVRITRDAEAIAGARGVVLPGVGNFGHCARELRRFGLDAPVVQARARGTPLLGLCVGMQLFFDDSEEDQTARGLGLCRGTVQRLVGNVRIPQTGWNAVRLRRSHPWLGEVPSESYFYFVHSYAPAPRDDVVIGTTDYGGEVPVIVGGDGFLGVQFHPEKSSRMGTRLLEGFVRGIG